MSGDRIPPHDREPVVTSDGGVVRPQRFASRGRALVAAAIVALAVVLFSLFSLGSWTGGKRSAERAEAETKENHEAHDGRQVELSPEALAAAKIEVESVTERPAVAPLTVTGTVESNQEQTQQVTPLVSGRVERVYVSLGDSVSKGAPVAVISSPDVAEMHGKLIEAETRLDLARRNLERVSRAENRAGVLAAKAKLDEAEATLRRTRRIVELGAGAGKDLVAAETAHTTAKAEYDYQSNIALNKEVQEAQAEAETAAAEVAHLRQSLRALGDETASSDTRPEDVALVTVRAPVSGTVTERLVNPGAGVEPGKPLFTVGNLSTVWVIANVPDAQVNLLREGTPTEISSAAAAEPLRGRINYIDPSLDEATRTARVRVEVENPDGLLRVGMFVRVGFQAGSRGDSTTEAEEVVVRSEAVQRIGERTVVFVPIDDEPGHYEVRDVELGGEVAGYRRVLTGLVVGDKVVTKGSFTLKTQLMKAELGEHED